MIKVDNREVYMNGTGLELLTDLSIISDHLKKS